MNMSDLQTLLEARQQLNQEIKVLKRAKGHWFKRTWQGLERSLYVKLHSKYGNSPAPEVQSQICASLDRLETILDKAIAQGG